MRNQQKVPGSWSSLKKVLQRCPSMGHPSHTQALPPTMHPGLEGGAMTHHSPWEIPSLSQCRENCPLIHIPGQAGRWATHICCT